MSIKNLEAFNNLNINCNSLTANKANDPTSIRDFINIVQTVETVTTTDGTAFVNINLDNSSVNYSNYGGLLNDKGLITYYGTDPKIFSFTCSLDLYSTVLTTGHQIYFSYAYNGVAPSVTPIENPTWHQIFKGESDQIRTMKFTYMTTLNQGDTIQPIMRGAGASIISNHIPKFNLSIIEV